MPIYKAKIKLKNGKIIDTFVKIDKSSDAKKYLKKQKDINFFKRIYYMFRFRFNKITSFFRK